MLYEAMVSTCEYPVEVLIREKKEERTMDHVVMSQPPYRVGVVLDDHTTNHSNYHHQGGVSVFDISIGHPLLLLMSSYSSQMASSLSTSSPRRRS